MNGEQVTIGNDAITRTFSIADGKLATLEIDNKRANTKLTPGADSEEFIIKRTKKENNVEPVQEPISTEGWTVSTDFEETELETPNQGYARHLIDNNNQTIWHSDYKEGGVAVGNLPHHVDFEFGKEIAFQSFAYDPRDNGGNPTAANGNISGYELLVNNDEAAPAEDAADAWTSVSTGEFDYSGNKGEAIHVNLDAPQVARRVRLVAKSSCNGKQLCGGEEFDLYAEKWVEPVKSDMFLKSSELELDGKPVVSDTSATINKQQKAGKKLSFKFKPVEFNGATYTVTENIVAYNGDHYMRKYLEISVPKDQAENAEIDYIDLESLNMKGAKGTWTIPTGRGGVVQMNEFRANLGQPIYAEGMFFGCEFPVTDTQIVDNIGRARYYSGKTMKRLAVDDQAKEVNGNICYNTWQTVAGAARGHSMGVVQADFFDYIDDISVPTEFRIQYNSWFDNMKNIKDDTILKSYIEIDRELDNVGVRPLDSYVVDDGWQDSTKDAKGVWSFNGKFPEGFGPSSELVRNFGSDFGVWIGPRGGYDPTATPAMADSLVKQGFGTKVNSAIDVADRTYLEKYAETVCNYQRDFHVNYWKWDGFAEDAQFNAWPATDGVPSRSTAGPTVGHMVGGTNHMYHVSDMWEAWIDLFEIVRANGEENKIGNLWISLTTYTNPSPWFLQWANSVWLQCVPDQAGAGISANDRSDSQMDRQLDARDAHYYDFINSHQFQFPLAHIYNHDPVYGKAGTGMTPDTATAEQFQNYLYTMAGRGTSFWELYFSDSLFDGEKYEVTGEFLAWAEANFNLLRNAKMFGSSPASHVKLDTGVNVGNTIEQYGNGVFGTYGYAGFEGEEGILTIRNADWKTAKDLTFKFDDATLGVRGETGDKFDYVVERHYDKTGSSSIKEAGLFTYGEDVTLKLQPEESLTIRVSKKKDADAPTIEKLVTDGDKIVTVKMSEKVKGEAVFTVNGQKIAADKISRSADDATYHITLDDAPKSGDVVNVSVAGLTDMAGNELKMNEASVTHRKGGVVASRCTSRLVGSAKKLVSAEGSLQSANGMGVFSYIELEGAGSVVSQAGAYDLGINAEGKAYFTMNGATATSDAKVNDGKPHTIAGVKENNGIIKVYVDGQLSAADYKVDNKGFMTPAADVVLGAGKVRGRASAKVVDRALGYDEIAKLTADVIPNLEDRNLAQGKNVSAKWTKDDSNAEKGNDGAMSLAVDGSHKSSEAGAYAEFGVDDRNESSYMEIDLGRVYELKEINLWRYFKENGRTYRNTVVAVSEDHAFDASDVIYNADADNVHKFGAGSDGGYVETGKGHTFNVPEKAKRARYVRVYMNGANNGNWSGNTNHVVECEVIGHDLSNSGSSDLDTAALADRIDAVNAEIAKGVYTTSSVAAVQKVLDEAELVLDCGKTQDEIAKALKSLEGIESKLVLRANLDAAKALLEKVKALNPDDYTTESFKAVEDAKTPVEQAVADNSDMTQEQLDKLVADLQAAYDALKKVEQPGPEKPEPPVVDPEQKPEQKPGSGAELPKTGDDSMLPIAAAGVAGGALVGAAVVLNKRRRAE